MESRGWEGPWVGESAGRAGMGLSTGTERMVGKVYSERTISFDFIRRVKPDGSGRNFVETM